MKAGLLIPTRIEPLTGGYDLGHTPQFKFSIDQAKAKAEGWSREDWRDYQNDPEHYQVEDPSSNRSHKWENKI
jgi:hypothetical protein